MELIERTLRALLAAAAIALIGSAAPARADEPKSAPLATNLAGNACSWGTAPAGSGAVTPLKPLDIVCGAKGVVAGTLWVAPLPTKASPDREARRAEISRAAQATPAGIANASRLACDAGQWLASKDGAALFSCTVRSNSWPRIALLAVVGDRLYQGEGLPSLLPVLEAAIAAASGHPFPAADADAASHLLATKFPPEIIKAGDSDLDSYKQFVELARLASGTQNYAGAESAYRRALAIEERLLGADAVPAGETVMELALQVSNQGRFDEAASLFRRAAPIIEASGSPRSRARLAAYLSLDAANQRHFEDALKFARQATAMRREQLQAATGADSALSRSARQSASRGELAHSLRIEAEMEMRLGDMATAAVSAAEVLAIIGEERNLPLWWRPEAITLVAEINARQGHAADAEREFREALDLERTLFGATAPTATAELRIGGFYADQQVYAKAIIEYRAALAILAKDPVARAGLVPDQLLPFFTAAAAVAREHPEQRTALDADAFRAFQFMNSGVADQTVAKAAARQATDDPALATLVRDAQDAQRQRDRARMELVAETARPDNERDAAREAKFADTQKLAADKADALSVRLRQAFPDYAKFADPQPAELAEIEKGLRPGEAFLTFVVGELGSYALLVKPDALRMERLDITATRLAADVADLRRAFTPRLGTVPDFDLRASFALYQRLLAPLEASLQGVDRLVVAPPGALASLPLALLVSQAPKPGSERAYGDAAWLVRRFALSEVPSPRAFLALRLAQARHAPVTRPFLGLGNPAFSGASGPASGNDTLEALAARCRDNGPIAPDLLRALAPLPETLGEVRTVAQLLGGNGDALLFGADATEKNLRAQPLDQFGVLYFATHGLLPGELHCQSEPGLVLSPPATAAKSTAEDGLLDASEIADLKLNADLVVLSACNTAAGGGQFGGEALSGLAAAFFNAGARSVLASHWEVPSAATVQLMTGLFGQVAKDRAGGLAEALRQSQLALLQRGATSHPFYWGAFTIVGDGALSLGLAGNPAQPGQDDTTRRRS